MIKRKRLIFCASIFCIGILIINYVGPRSIIQVHSGLYTFLKPKPIPKFNAKDFKINTEKFSFKTEDEFNISCLLIRASDPNSKGTIILVHGIRSAKERFLPIAKRLSSEGYNSVMVDLRAHGESEGVYCTFGFYEKKDLKLLIDLLLTMPNLSPNIGIWGQSLGGAIALQTLAIDNRIKYGIIESAFSDFRVIVHDYVKQTLGFDIPFITNYMIYRAENIGHFYADSVRPVRSANDIRQPVLLIHGQLDQNIKIEYARENFENLAGYSKEFCLIIDANHNDVLQKGGEMYYHRVFDFLTKQISEK